MKKNLKISILIAVITCIISISGAYAATTYVISANNQYKINIKGGSSTVTLSKANIPSLSVTGTTNSTGNGYTIGYNDITRTTGTGNAVFYRLVSGAGGSSISNHVVGHNGGYGYNDYYASTISGLAAHTHTFTGNYTSYSLSSINIQNPYTAVYMYKRVK